MQAIVAGKRHRPVIRLFVSSTFVDLKHERDALQRDTFQRLEAFCARRGFQFQAIDLRWGVPSDASLDHRTMRICFEELRRSQEISPEPNFLILLGNRYGWRPLPEEISEEEFQKLEQAIATLPETGQVLAKATLDAWYRHDDNGIPPVYILQSRMRDLGDGKNYGRDDEDRDTQDWLDAQAVLWSIINQAFPASGLGARFVTTLDDYRRRVADDPAAPLPSVVRFQASATEQEIWRGAFAVPNASEHVLAYIREIDNGAEFSKEAQAFVDADEKPLQELKSKLAKQIGDRNVVEFKQVHLRRSSNDKGVPLVDVTTEHLAEMCDRIYTALEAIIQRQIDAHWGEASARSARDAAIERNEHQRFGLDRAPETSFVGRDQERKRIAAYLQNDSRQPLVVHGESGCGKTALLAKASQDAAKDGKPIVRFLGVTPHSSEVRSLLSSLCQELRQRNPRSDKLSGDVRELTRELLDHFRAATAERPLIVFLDALDQLADADNGRRLNWIPFGPLPAHVKIVVSCLSDRKPDDPAGEPFAALQQRGLAEQNFVHLDALAPDEAHTLVFDRWLPEARRQLNPEQQRRIQDRLNFAACRQPLYLKILFEEARLWHSYDTAPQLGENVDSLLDALFTRLENPANHGPTVQCALGYLASARRGLTEIEILEILYKEREYEHSPFKMLLDRMASKHELPESPPRIPIAIWSRLRFDLAPYLAEHAAPGATVLSFYHRNLFKAVGKRYLASEEQQRQAHGRLTDYFHAQDFWQESLEEQQRRAKTLPPTPRPANVRKVDELPWQLLQAVDWQRVEQLLTDLPFLEAKAEAGMVFDLAIDFSAVIGGMPADRPLLRILRLLEEAFRRDIHFITRYPTTLFQCLWNSCWWYDCAEAAAHYVLRAERRASGQVPWEAAERPLSLLLEQWRANKERSELSVPWLRSLRPPEMHLGTPQKLIMQGHTDVVKDVCFSPDGQYLASGSDDNTVRLWDASCGVEVLQIRGHTGRVYGVCYSPSGRHLASASFDMTVQIWDSSTGAAVLQLRGHTNWVTCLCFSPDGRRIASGSYDKTVRVWDASSGAELLRLQGHDGWLACVCFSPDGLHLASGSIDNTVRLWDASSGVEVLQLRGHKGGVNGVCFSPDGQQFASASNDKTVRVWDASRGAVVFQLQGHTAWVMAVCYSPDGQRIASAAADRTVRVWDASGGTEILQLRGHTGIVESVCFSPDGLRIAGGSGDRTVRVWELSDGAEVLQLRGDTSWVNEVCFSPDGLRLAVACSAGDNTVRVWDASSGIEVLQLRGQSSGARRLYFSPDGRRLASITHDDSVHVWDATSGAELLRIPKHKCLVNCVCFSPDGLRLAFAATDTEVRVWDVSQGSEVLQLRGHTCGVNAVCFSPDGRRIASASNDKTVRLWDVCDKGTVQTWWSWLKSLGRLFVRDPSNGAELIRFWGHISRVNCVCFSPDGRRLASGAYDGAVRVWDASSGAVVFQVQAGDTSQVQGVCFSPDGRRLAAASFDRVVRVWDASTGACLEVHDGASAADLPAFAAQPSESPWRGMTCGFDTVVADAATGHPVAGFPTDFSGRKFTSSASGRTWAWDFGPYVYLITLEGPPAPSLAVRGVV